MRAALVKGAALAPDVEESGTDTAVSTLLRCPRQVFDLDGHRLPPRRAERIEDAPTLATSTVWRWARDRWCELAQ